MAQFTYEGIKAENLEATYRIESAFDGQGKFLGKPRQVGLSVNRTLLDAGIQKLDAPLQLLQVAWASLEFENENAKSGKWPKFIIKMDRKVGTNLVVDREITLTRNLVNQWTFEWQTDGSGGGAVTETLEGCSYQVSIQHQDSQTSNTDLICHPTH